MTCLVGGVLEGEGEVETGGGGAGRDSLLGVRYTIVLRESVIKECVEDFIKHAIRVGIINEGLFADIYVLDKCGGSWSGKVAFLYLRGHSLL